MRIAHGAIMATSAAALLLAGCGKKTLELPTDPIERAATCGVVTAVGEREKAGIKGELPAEAQGRIFQYPLLAASEGENYDADKSAAVFKAMPELSDKIIASKWQELRAPCDQAYPATKVADPQLPSAPADAALQCLVLTDFMRKSLADQGNAYAQDAVKYGALTTKLDAETAKLMRRAGGLSNDALQAKRRQALAAAAKLGQPAAVIAACEKKYG